MYMKKVLVAAIMALVLGASFPAIAQQQSGTIAGMSPAMAAAAGLGVIVAGVLIADEIGSDGSSDLFPLDPPVDPPVEPPPVTTTTTTTTN